MTPTERTARALELFDALVDLPQDEQQDRLASLRRDDPELESEVVRMLAADKAPDGVIDLGLHAMAMTVANELGAQAAGVEGASGKRIGPFSLTRLLGRGGMGEVWLAQRADGDFRQEVALKLLKRGMDSDDMLRRFAQERRILADLSHANIARFIDGGVSEDGASWYAMEYVDGQPITDHARIHSLTVRERVAMIAEVAEAVAYAQSRLVVHRDLKPSNIMVDGAGGVHLLDFGIAKLLAGDIQLSETATGIRAMSPAYAAPEQVLGEAISTATDVYSLGVVLYELLTGCLPHRRSAATLHTLADMVRTESVEKPSMQLRRADSQAVGNLGTTIVTAQRFARESNGELDLIVLTALRREPDRRYVSAAAFADDLRRWLDGRPVSAQPDTRRYRITKFVTRHRLAVGSSIAVVAAVIIGLGAALWQANVARIQAVRAQEQAVRAVAIKDFFVSILRNSNPIRQRDGAQVTARELIETAAARIDGELDEAPEAKAEIRVVLGAALIAYGAMNEAKPHLQSAIEFLRAAATDDVASATLATALHLMSQVQRDSGDPDASQALLEEALTVNARIGDSRERMETDLELRTSLLRLANARANHADALEIGRSILATRARLFGAHDPRLAVDWNNIGQTLNMLENAPEAEAALSRALTLLRSDPQSPQARQPTVLVGLCLALTSQGKLAQARQVADEARMIGARALSATHPMTQRALICDANALRYQGQASEALRVVDQVLEADSGVDPEGRRVAMLARSRLLLASNQDRAALDMLSAVRDEFATEPHRARFTALEVEFEYARALARNRQVAQAVEVVEAALPLLRSQAIYGGYRRGEALVGAAEVFAAAANTGRAQALREEGQTLWKNAWKPGGAALPQFVTPL